MGRIFILVYIAASLLCTDTLRITTYNILNFPGAFSTERLDDLRCVLEYVSPDVLVVQEMESQAGVDLMRDSVLNVHSVQYRSEPFHDGPDTDNALFYRSDRVTCVWSGYLQTLNRDIAEYRLRINGYDELYVYSVHLKSSQGDTNELIRLQEATVLRKHLDSLVQGTNVIVAGDYNLYTSDEPAFQMLTSDSPYVHSRLYDPLFLTGSWHDNVDCAVVHTQSTRDTMLPDGGATGGLDDRFDMILCSEGLLEHTGLYLDADDYFACGNDGMHFDMAVNDGLNSAVPMEIAHALYYAADHLPVTVSIYYAPLDDVAAQALKIWPNPMTRHAFIGFPYHDHFQRAELDVMDITGRSVFREEVYASDGYTLENCDLAIGVYFVTATIYTVYSRYVYHGKLAVTD